MALTARYDLITMALFGLISCFLAALEKSMMIETNLISDFLWKEELNLSIFIFFTSFFDITVVVSLTFSFSENLSKVFCM